MSDFTIDKISLTLLVGDLEGEVVGLAVIGDIDGALEGGVVGCVCY